MKTLRHVLLTSLLVALIFTTTGCAQKSLKNNERAKPSNANTVENEPRYTYHEFDMLCLFYRTNDIATYKKLLPKQFQMPEEPLVMVFFADYYDMDNATDPYLETAVLLKVNYKDKPAWHCVTMPVTSDEARLGGIHYLGYPKIMGDISFQRNTDQFKGTLNLNNKPIMSVTHNTKDHFVTQEEKQMFERLKGLPNLNILNGQVFKVKFGKGSGQYSLLQLSKMYPDALEVKVGKSNLVMDSNAAGEYSKPLGDIFSIRPSKMMLAYYLKNKTVMRFEN